tara:strand:+ start:81 stop:509 length:429 start_codon:yes stop_codon:yes gene_type:complete
MAIKENNDTLITFGKEALTMRKDDPRTQEYKEKMLKQMEEKKKMYEDAKKDPFKGVNLKNERAEDETYDEYKERLKLNKLLQKQYRQFGRDKFIEMYPAGVKYAIDMAKEEIAKRKNNVVVGKVESIDKDGNKQEIKLNNNE